MGVVASTTGILDEWDIEPLAHAAQAALDAAEKGEWELSLLVCDDAFIRPLNQQWRDKDMPTDVLSFPQLLFTEPEVPTVSPEPPFLLGDVVISLETAQAAASELGHAVDVEMRVLMVHGLCHLLGHEHGTPEQRERMAHREAELLSALELPSDGLVARSDRNG